MFGCFARNEQGNVAMLVAVTLLPIMFILGGAVDIARANVAKAQLQSAIDGAALAAANFSQNGQTEAVVRDYIKSNYPQASSHFSSMEVRANIADARNRRVVEVEVDATLQTQFLHMLTIRELDIEVESTAEHAVSKIELAMVLDISSSMRGQKVANLKTAAEDFVTDMLEEQNSQTTSINLVPFGGTVNVGPAIFNRFIVDMDDAELDPDEDDYDEGQSVPNEEFRFSNGDTCLEYPNTSFNDGLLSEDRHGQVPHFWRWWNFHPWCPGEASAVLMNAGEMDDIVDRIRGMTLSDGTGMNYGAMWGLKSLSPAWQGSLGGDFSDRPAAYDDTDTLKAMIIMTDGEITEQNRPEDYTLLNVHTNRSFNTQPNSNSFSNQGNRRNMQRVLNRGNASSNATSNTAVGQFRRVCNEARANGIIVYTIGFQINRNGLSNTLLSECATDPSKYIFVEDLDIQAAFDEIAASLSRLRITG